jgi:hypothetical protein
MVRRLPLRHRTRESAQSGLGHPASTPALHLRLSGLRARVIGNCAFFIRFARLDINHRLGGPICDAGALLA